MKRKIGLIIAVVAIISCFVAISVFAGNSFDKATNIYVNQTVSGSCTSSDIYEYYVFSINYTAEISFSANWNHYGSYGFTMSLYDNNRMLIDSKSYYGNGGEPITKLLDAGTYYVKISYPGSCTYNFSVLYEACEETIPESQWAKNDARETADIIFLNQSYVGAFTYNETSDIHKFKLEEPKNVMVAGMFEIDGWIEIYDEYGTHVTSVSIYGSDEELGGGTIYLDPGVYYFSVTCYSSANCGMYYFGVYDADNLENVSAPKRSLYNEVEVTVPEFPIVINGVIKDNTYAKYPYIYYNGITYCPMTYFGSRFLGLETGWDATNGLSISRLEDGSEGFGDTEIQNTPNFGKMIATINTDDFIVVNGKQIDNFSEEFPVLKFRDVTYFPLTWRFTVDEFGWENTYSETYGLSIYSE